MLNKPSQKTVLLIEDDQFIRELIAEALKKNNVRVEMAINGNEAARKIEAMSDKLDLILLDIILPDKNGYEILELARSRPELKKIPIIVISNLGQEEEIKKAMDLGAKAYLIKAQSDIDDIVKKVQEFLGDF